MLSNDGLLQYGGMEACYNTTGCTVSDEGWVLMCKNDLSDVGS